MRTVSLAMAAAMALAGAAAMPARAAQQASPAAAGTRNAITGRVVDSAGQPVPGVFVTLLRNESSNGIARVGIVRMGLGVRTDATGTYRLENLDLGSYYVVALPEQQVDDWRDPKTLERLVAVATPVTILEGQHRTIDLRLREVRH